MSDRRKPQIVVYALADACAALRVAGEKNMAVTLVSPAGAAGFAGPGWFREVVAQARVAVPGASFDSVLDCAGEAGLALAAIRDGVEAICFDGRDDVRNKVQDIATQTGCALAAIDYENALDLDACEDAAAACREWLSRKMAENET